MRRPGPILAVCLVPAAVALSSCGEEQTQASDTPAGAFKMSASMTFPKTQSLAQRTTLKVLVNNDGSETVPDAAVSLTGLTQQATQPNLNDATRPVWIVETPPAGGITADNRTWALGPLAPGASRTFTWTLTAIVAGKHTLRYRVGASLTGKARAESQSGAPVRGSLTVTVSEKPKQERVADDGSVVPVD